MTVPLYQRVCRVVAGGLAINTDDPVAPLRCKFHVTKTKTREPNTLKLAIYNLSQNSRAQLQGKGVPIVLEAGYVGTTTQIFSGPSRTIDHKHVGPDWISEIECGDGEVAYRYSYVSKSFAPGAFVADVFAQVAQAFAQGQAIDIADAVSTVRANVTDQYTRGYSASGRAVAELTNILTGRGLEWSIQDGKLQVLKGGQPTKKAAVLISQGSGMIGSPEHGEPHASPQPDLELLGSAKVQAKPVLRVKSLLLPITPGDPVSVKAQYVSGDFMAQYVEHTGDSFGQEFYTTCELVPL